MNDGFIFYKSFLDSIRMLPKEEQLKAFDALAGYAIYGEEPQGTGLFRVVYEMAKPQIEANQKKRSGGSKGGRPKRETYGFESEKPMVMQNENLNININKKKNKNININNICAAEAASAVEDKSDSTHDVEDESDKVPYREIIEYLNQKLGTQYKVGSKNTRAHIHARFDEGYTLEDFKTVIDKMVILWGKDSKMNRYLRPDTLFGSKFESYLNIQCTRQQTNNSFRNFEERDIDYDDLEAQLDRQMMEDGST